MYIAFVRKTLVLPVRAFFKILVAGFSCKWHMSNVLTTLIKVSIRNLLGLTFPSKLSMAFKFPEKFSQPATSKKLKVKKKPPAAVYFFHRR